MRSRDEIEQSADELSRVFEYRDHAPTRSYDGTPLRIIRRAFLARKYADQALREAIDAARAEGYPWTMIGAMVGLSSEATEEHFTREPRSSVADL